MRLLLCCLIILTWTGAARAACSVRPRATVALTVTGGPILVPLAVNRTPATFILDTGAERSLVTQAAVTRLGLALDEWVGTTMRGVGGIERRRNADPRSLTLGGVVLQRHTLNHDTSLVVGNMPRAEVEGRTVDGLLGRDFLSVFDLAIDMPAQTLTLYDVTGCSGRFLPWTGAYSAVPVQNPMESALVAQITLDGMPMRALIDTGASSSVVGAPGMARLGLTEAELAGDPSVAVSGQGPRMVTMRRHRFASLQVGEALVRGPELWVAPIRFTPISEMLLGADWLAGKVVWISYASRQVFVASQ